MALVSAVSLLKIFLLAVILPKADFALYASVFAVVAFASEIISFGLTHATVKKYPRLVAFNRAREINPDLRRLGKTLGLRYLAIYVVLSLVSASVWGVEGWIAVSGVLLIAMGTSMFSVIASVCRAFDHLIPLAGFGLLRTLAATAAALVAARMASWQTVLLAEGIVVACVGIAVLWVLHRDVEHRSIGGGDVASTGAAELVSGKHDGVLTFVAFLLLMIPGSFDRMFVSAFDAVETKSLYAFVGIWMTAAVTVLGIYTQKFGPDMVRLLALAPETNARSVVRRHALLLVVLITAGTLVSFALVRLFLFERMWSKYGLSWEVAVVTAVTAATLVTVLYDWMLIALDGEKQLLHASIALVTLVSLLFVGVAYFQLGFNGYMAALFVARVVQLMWQDTAVARLQSSRAVKPRP